MDSDCRVLSMLCSLPDAGSSTSLAGRQAGAPPKHHLSSTANNQMLTLARENRLCPDARELLTSFLAIFGVVFLNLEVLKRFMLLSQIDFRAFRVSLSSWLVLGRGLLLQLTVQFGRAVSARFARRSWPFGRSVCFPRSRGHHAPSRATPGNKTCASFFYLTHLMLVCAMKRLINE